MPAQAGGWNVLVVPHTHWDREWYLPFQLFRRRLVGVISEVLERLEADPTFPSFTLDGQTVVLEDYLEVEPDAEERLARQVRAGRLLVGPWYVQPDEFLVSGEALIRNLLMGSRVADRFGGRMRVGYCPDSFGHIAQLPQILRGFGLGSLLFSRGLGDEGERLGSEFIWQAPDGSRVLAIHQLGGALDRTSGYLNAALLGYPRLWGDDHGAFSLACAQEHANQLIQRLGRYAHTPFLLFSNGGDHLGPQPELPRVLAGLNASVPGARFTAATFPQYVGLVARARASGAAALPRWSGELRGARYNHILAGVLSTRVPLKQANARAQVVLERWAEPFGALSWLEGGPDPRPFLRLAWRLVLHNQAHDSICGCSADQVHVEMAPRFDQAEQLAESVAAAGIEHLLGQVHSLPLPPGPLVTVFNPLGAVRTGLATGRVRLPPELCGRPLEAVAVDGTTTACQVLSAEPDAPALVALSAPSIPSVGYRTFALRAAETPQASRGLHNERYCVEVASDGRLRITHLPTGHVVDGAHLLVDEADAGDEYTFAPAPDDEPVLSAGVPARRSLVQAGPAVASLAIDQRLWLPAELEGDRRRRTARQMPLRVHSQVSLTAEGRWVEVQVEVDNTARDHRLRVVCPTGVRSTQVEALGQFLPLRRPVAPPARREWLEDTGPTGPQQGYVAVVSDRLGVALLSPELPEYLAEPGAGGVDLSLTLLRCVGWLSRSDLSTRPAAAGPSLPTPQAQCPGRHAFRYAVAVFDAHEAPHLPTWAESYRAPLRLFSARRQAGALSADLSLVQVNGAVVLTGLKPAEDGRGIIARLYNPKAVAAVAVVGMRHRLAACWRCRLDETPLARLAPHPDGQVRLSLGPHAIGTLRLIAS